MYSVYHHSKALNGGNLHQKVYTVIILSCHVIHAHLQATSGMAGWGMHFTTYPKFSFLSFLHLTLLMTFMYRESCSICAMCSENILYISTAVCAGGRVVNLETTLKGQRDVQHPAHYINNNLDLHCKRKNNSHMSRKQNIY